MNLPIIFMYSGQGSQYYQMGRSLYEENKTFKKVLTELNVIYESITGRSVLSRLYDENASKSQPFDQTAISHPAIFMIEQALTQLLYEKDIFPSAVLGTSLGEFSAAVTSRALRLEDAFMAVIKQGQLLEKCPPGGMLAVLYDTNLYLREPFLFEHSELAAINFNSHFVVAGTNENLLAIANTLKERGITFQLLPVKQAFHSSLIDSAETSHRMVTDSLTLKEPNIGFISSMKTGFIDMISKDHFWDIVRKPILFQETITHLEATQPSIYIDVGPSGTLATFVKYNLHPTSASTFYSTLSPFGNEKKNLDELSKALTLTLK